MTYRGNFSKHPVAPETGSLVYTGTRLAQSSDLELKPTQATLLVCLSWDALCVPQAVGSKRGLPVPHISGQKKKKLKISKQKYIYIYIFIHIL